MKNYFANLNPSAKTKRNIWFVEQQNWMSYFFPFICIFNYFSIYNQL